MSQPLNLKSFFNLDPQAGLTAQDIIEHPKFKVTQRHLESLMSVEYGHEALVNWAVSEGFEYEDDECFDGLPSASKAIAFILKAERRSKREAKQAKANAQRAMIRKHIRPFGA